MAELQTSLSALEWQEWLAYADIDPWTPDRDDLRPASSPMRLPRRPASNARLVTFLPRWRQAEREQTEDEQKFALMKMTKLLGGQVKQLGK